MDDKQDFLNNVRKIWNSIEPLSYDEVNEVEILNDIKRFDIDVIKKEKQISSMLKGFVITRNLKKEEQEQIEEEIRSGFTEFLDSISKK